MIPSNVKRVATLFDEIVSTTALFLRHPINYSNVPLRNQKLNSTYA